MPFSGKRVFTKNVPSGLFWRRYVYTKIANSYDAGAYDHDLNYAKNKLNRVSL